MLQFPHTFTDGGTMMQDIRNNETSECRDLRILLARRTGTDPDEWFLTFRAREAMQTVFEQIRRHSGSGDVIIQPFTCSTVPEAVCASHMGLRVAGISCITNMAAGINAGPLSEKEVLDTANAASAQSCALVKEFIKRMK